MVLKIINRKEVKRVVYLYEKDVTLREGTKVKLRELTKEDRLQLLDLFANISAEDAKFLKENVKDKKVIERWIEELDYTKTLPIVADHEGSGRLIGDAVIDLRVDPRSKHVGKVSVTVHKDYRGRGLGSELMKFLAEIAEKQLKLLILHAEVPAPDIRALMGFQSFGFREEGTLKKRLMTDDGYVHGIIVMSKELNPEIPEMEVLEELW